jgi:uncharacterized cupin superfamily protein
MAQVLHYTPSLAGEVHQPGRGYRVGRYAGDGAPGLDGVVLGIVEAGELRLSGQGFDLHVQAGDCFVVPQGVAVDWQAGEGLRYVYMAFERLSGEPSHAHPLKLELLGELQPCSPPPAEVLLSATPNAWSRAGFEQGPLRIGVWACEPYARRQVEPGYSELMHIIEGQLMLIEASGAEHRVCAGETLVVPAGATNAWTSQTLVRKVYCILG